MILPAGRLQRLDLSFNRFEELPMESGNLELLNELGEWEVGIGLLRELRFLDLRGNKFSVFPEQIERLELLEELYISENELLEIPQDIGSLEKLKILHIQNNKITKMATDFYHLHHLQELRAEHNELSSLPPTEAELHPEQESLTTQTEKEKKTPSALRKADFSFNRFAHMDDRWSHFAALRTLSLAHNALESMSEGCFASCRSLTHLDLSHNRLTDVSLSLSNASQLTVCDLSHNLLRDAPSALFRCTKMKTLNLSHNALQDLSGKVLGMLLDLERLEVAHNEITRLPALLFTGAKKMKHFDCGHNLVTELPTEIEQWAESVRHMDLSYNRLQSLPETLCACMKLETLHLDHNALQDLPSQMQRLRALKTLTIQNNALRSTRHVLAVLPWLLHSNLSWNRDVTVRAMFARERVAQSEEERRFTIFGAHLEEYYTRNAQTVRPLSFLRKRVSLASEELEKVVQSLPQRERDFAADANSLRDAKGLRATERNFETLLRWLTKLRDHVVMDERRLKEQEDDEDDDVEQEEERDKERGHSLAHGGNKKTKDHKKIDFNELNVEDNRKIPKNRHANLRERLCRLYEQRNTVSSTPEGQRIFHDLLVQALAARLTHANKTRTKIYHSDLQFRQLRPLMHFPFSLAAISLTHGETEAHKTTDEREHLREDVANALFLGFELVKPLETLCELLEDANLLAMIEELNAAKESRLTQELSAEKEEESKAALKEQLLRHATSEKKKKEGEKEANASAKEQGGLFSLFNRKASQQRVTTASAAFSDEQEQREREAREEDERRRAREERKEQDTLHKLRALPLPDYPFFSSDNAAEKNNERMRQVQGKGSYFAELLSRLAPFCDVDLISRPQSVRSLHAPLPLMSFPFLTLLAQDEREKESFGVTHHSQDEPFGASLFSLLFELNLLICKALIAHVECVQRSIRALERVGGEKFSRLSHICQRDVYYQPTVNEQTGETEVSAQEDYEDLLADIYASVFADKATEEKLKRIAENSIGRKRRQNAKEFVDLFFAQGELKNIEFIATESIFKERDHHQQENAEDTETAEKEKTKGSSSLSRSQSADVDDRRRRDEGLRVSIPAHELLLQALGLPTKEGEEREKEKLNDLEDSLLMINTANPSPKELETMQRVENTRTRLANERARRKVTAQHRIRVWCEFLLEYRHLLLVWGAQCMENCMAIVKSRGFDFNESQWDRPTTQMSFDYRDPRFLERQEAELISMAFHGTDNTDGNVPTHSLRNGLVTHKKQVSTLSPVVVRHVQDEARRCMMYRFRLFQCFPVFQDCVVSYEVFLKFSQGYIPLQTYVGYVKTCLSQGNFTKAKELLALSWRKFFGKELRTHWEAAAREAEKSALKKKIIVPANDSDLMIPKASDLLKINREMAVLWKFTEIQVEALNKVGVYSTQNKRVFRVREDGLMRINEDYRPPEIMYGRDLEYQRRMRFLEEQQQRLEAEQAKKKEEEELIDSVMGVKTKLSAFLKEDTIRELLQSMKLTDLLDEK